MPLRQSNTILNTPTRALPISAKPRVDEYLCDGYNKVFTQLGTHELIGAMLSNTGTIINHILYRCDLFGHGA